MSVFMAAGCAKKNQPTSVDGQVAEYGDYSRSEIGVLRAAIARLTFPVAEHTVAKLLPRPVEPTPVEFIDSRPERENKGKIGGNVVDYWLNRNTVLRVATAYYVDGEKHFSLEEWAVILSSAERDTYSRRAY